VVRRWPYDGGLPTRFRTEPDKSNRKYLIDPLDGTHNYYFGLPFWGVAAAVLDSSNKPCAAVIYIPMMKLLMKCEMDEPTMVWSEGGWELVKTRHKDLSRSLICYDNQFYKLGLQAVQMFEQLTRDCFTIRIMGSAVCDAALIACGKVNARIWNNTNPYDIGAGIKIVEGAGGEISDFNGNEINVLAKQVIMCSDKSLQSELLDLFTFRH